MQNNSQDNKLKQILVLNTRVINREFKEPGWKFRFDAVVHQYPTFLLPSYTSSVAFTMHNHGPNKSNLTAW